MEIAKLIASFFVAMLLVFSTFGGAFAQEAEEAEEVEAEEVELELEIPENETGGVGPDKPFLWGLDRALERIRMALTFGTEAKAAYGLKIAEERLLEAQVMAKEKKLEAMVKAKVKHGEILARIKEKVEAIEDDEKPEIAKQALELEAKIEKRLAEHEGRVATIKADIEIKIRGKLTAEQQAALDELLEAFTSDADKLRVDIKEKKERTRIRYKAVTEKTDEEIEMEIEEIEEEVGLVRMEKRAAEQIEDAVEALAEAKAIVEEANITAKAVLTLVSRSEERLSQAQSAFDAENYGEAFGQAMAAERLALNAEMIAERGEEIAEKIEKLKEKIEERRAKMEEEMEEEALERMEEAAEEAEIEIENLTMAEVLEELAKVRERRGR